MSLDHISSDDFAAAEAFAAHLAAKGDHIGATLVRRLTNEILIMRHGCLDGVTAEPRIKAEHTVLSAIPAAVSACDADLLSSLAATLTALRAR